MIHHTYSSNTINADIDFEQNTDIRILLLIITLNHEFLLVALGALVL